jgi:TolB protein
VRRGVIVGGMVAASAGLLAAPAAATFPGQNGRIAFDNNGHIVTMKPDGSDRRRLTRGKGNFAPSYSPSGARITFSHRVGKHFVIDVMHADGTHKRQLTRRHVDRTPSFSPNGRKIVFSRNLHTSMFDFAGIFRMRADGTHVRLLTHDRPVFSDVELDPTYSPDGKTIVFTNLLAEDGAISAMDADGRHVRQLTDNRVDPDFSPSGQHILFSELFVAIPQLGIMDPDGKHAHDFTNNHDPHFDYSLPAYSPDGTKIAFSGGTNGSDVFVMNADGSGVTQLTHNGHSGGPAWGPRRTGQPAG